MTFNQGSLSLQPDASQGATKGGFLFQGLFSGAKAGSGVSEEERNLTKFWSS